MEILKNLLYHADILLGGGGGGGDIGVGKLSFGDIFRKYVFRNYVRYEIYRLLLHRTNTFNVIIIGKFISYIAVLSLWISCTGRRGGGGI